MDQAEEAGFMALLRMHCTRFEVDTEGKLSKYQNGDENYKMVTQTSANVVY